MHAAINGSLDQHDTLPRVSYEANHKFANLLIAGSAEPRDIRAVLGVGRPTTPVARTDRRRQISPRDGRALELLGHSIEYLADEFALQLGTSGSCSAQDPQIQALQILMKANRDVYFNCPTVPKVGERWHKFWVLQKRHPHWSRVKKYAKWTLRAVSLLLLCYLMACRVASAEPATTAPTLAQAPDTDSVFSDLSTEYDGGVANPTDGSTGNVLQETLFAAYLWGSKHGNARATVVVSSDYPITGSRILIPGNVDLVCSSYSPHNYSGGCNLYQADRGSDTATGGSPLLMADYRFGLLPDGKTLCSTNDIPQQPGCTIINSAGASIRGFTLYGGFAAAGGADIGIRVFAGNVTVQDTNVSQFGGPGIQAYGGLNNSFDWNFGTNVDSWWCAHPSALVASGVNLGAMDLGMIDGEASHNQYSTGCSFSKSFAVSREYPHLAAMSVTGAGNLIQSNLLQVDGIGLIADGMEHRVTDNRVEYASREAIRNISSHSIFSNNRITSACLDPNLINLRPGSLDSGRPRYPNAPTFLHNGYIVMDPNGNIEQMIGSSGTSGPTAPDWAVEPDGTTVDGDTLTWQNMGPWPTTTPLSYWAQPSLVTGVCYAVYDEGGDNTWSSNQVNDEAGVNGFSYSRGSYFIAGLASITGNTCERDLPDAYGNGQCWWGGDLFSNGGPMYLAPNEQKVAASGGGTAWVGDYSVLVLTDNVPRHYNDFQGMAQGQNFSVTSSTVANVIDPWSVNGSGGGTYGHPSLQTCTGGPLVITPGSYFQFYYDLSSPYAVTQVDCSSVSGPDTISFVSLSPGALTFASQQDGTTSTAQTVTLSNISDNALSLLIAVSDDFSQTSTCGGSLAIGASCHVSVTFTPTTSGAHVGVLTIVPNGSGSSQSVVLTGTGSEPSSSNSSSPGTVVISSASASLEMPSTGQTVTTTLMIASHDSFSGRVNLKCQISSENQAVAIESLTCAVSPAQVQITNSSGAVSSVVVSRTGLGEGASRDGGAPYRSMSLGSLCLIGVLSFAGGRKGRNLVGGLVLILGAAVLSGMAGCGYAPNLQSGNYKVLITATTGAQTSTSISVPLQVQAQ